MYYAMDIARYIINFCIDIGNPISNLKLQKILYYVQAAFMIEECEPCFNEEIAKWRHGPVVIDVYQSYKKFIGGTINERQEEYIDYELANYEFVSNFLIKRVTKTFDADIIKERHRKLINKVVLGLIGMDDWDLVQKTQEEDPYINTEKDEIITIASIYAYFNNSFINEGRIYGKYYTK